jgi:Flp pilus assembly protein CpaB
MVAATLTPARALRRPRRADPRALLGVLLTLAALAGSISFWAASSESRPVLIATRELPAGSTLRAADLSIAYVRMEDDVYAAALSSDQLDSLVGRQLAEPVHNRQVLARAQVAERNGLSPDQVAITVPARPDTAVDGRLKAGDAVQVLVTVSDKARGEARTRVVLDRVQVFSVGREQSLSSSSAAESNDAYGRGSIASVTLAVTSDQARLLAEARRSGELDILLLPRAGAADQP